MSENEIGLPEYWPRIGERLFIPGSPGRDAELSENFDERMYRMKAAFKKAADLMVDHTQENPRERSNLVWPIVFCYRQYIELALKDVIGTYGKQVEPTIEPTWNKHGLNKLWTDCKSIMGHVLVGMTPDEMPEILAIEALLREFEKVDAGSFAFRYPNDTKGTLIEIPIYSVDLINLRQVMEGVYTFLDCNEEVLKAHLDI